MATANLAAPARGRLHASRVGVMMCGPGGEQSGGYARGQGDCTGSRVKVPLGRIVIET